MSIGVCLTKEVERAPIYFSGMALQLPGGGAESVTTDIESDIIAIFNHHHICRLSILVTSLQKNVPNSFQVVARPSIDN